jgi:hypothetical protein
VFGPQNHKLKANYLIKAETDRIRVESEDAAIMLLLLHRLAYNSDLAAGQLAVLQGASEVGQKSEFFVAVSGQRLVS